MYFISLLAIVTGLFSFSFKARHASCKAASKNYPSGASANLGAGYTGASWDNSGRTCSQSGCHSGGAYNPTTTLTLLSGTTTVTQYIPGTVYTFSMKITAASGTPKYAFNAMCATTAVHTNINKWGTMPTGTKNTIATSRNYIEQSSARTATGTSPTSYYILSVPWTAPAAGTGSVTFYAEGMAVNGNGVTSGDSPAPGVNLTIMEASVLPVSISSVTAQKTNNGIRVSWTAEQEINTGFYTVEHSVDGNHFAALGNIAASSNAAAAAHTYTYIDNSILTGKQFYRIVEVDLDGKKTYSRVATITIDNKKAFDISPNPVADFITLPVNQFTGSTYLLNSINGMKIATGIIQGSKIGVASLVHGTYILTVIQQSGEVQSVRFIKE